MQGEVTARDGSVCVCVCVLWCKGVREKVKRRVKCLWFGRVCVFVESEIYRGIHVACGAT